MIISKLNVMKEFDWFPPIYGVDEEIKELEMVRKFKSYNVIRERVELYKDFAINLLYFVHGTYLGKEYLKNEKDIRGHFTWCYGKVLDDFDSEGISFYENDKLYDYFYGYYLDGFYKLNKIESLTHYENFWENIFDVKNTKKRNIFEVLLQLYEIFDETITKKTQEFELV